MMLRMARLTDDAGEASGNVPRPQSDFANVHAYNGLPTSLSVRLLEEVQNGNELEAIHHFDQVIKPKQSCILSRVSGYLSRNNLIVMKADKGETLEVMSRSRRMYRGLHQPERRIDAKRLKYNANQPAFSGEIHV
ncbi:unnamed protein product [Protopolystoma xenopodis]|uniref:Uncharacterized protein n=1 Tax=Protopolystoma xenopodis TaxID=117903 RepID=A0A448XND3_9PLAT|nr:unnamed protein product [Protopolystoma xenopodis]